MKIPFLCAEQLVNSERQFVKMIEEKKKIEYWNFLTLEKNQPRPKAITQQRLAVIKPLVIGSDVWQDVIGPPEINSQSAAEFYQSGNAASKLSRTVFWAAVRGIILQAENLRVQIAGHHRKTPEATTAKKKSR